MNEHTQKVYRLPMNYSQLKQQLQNNIWFGEQRRDVMQEAVTSALVQPDYNSTWGIDVSPWDGVVRLDITKALGASFVYIKAIDGTIQSKYFVENRQAARDIDLLHGPYGWLYRNANVSCVKQAQAYDTLLNKYPMTLPPVIDFEPTKWNGQASNPTFADLRLWAIEWARLNSSVKPILYSRASYMNQFGTITAELKELIAGLWVAHYGVNNPAMPYGWATGGWLFHQNNDKGDASIIAPNSVGKKETDLDVAKSKAKLYELAGLAVPDPEPPTGGTMSFFQATGSQVIRTAGNNTAPLGVLGGTTQYILGPMSGSGSYGGDVVECEAPIGGYMKIKRLWRNGAWTQLPPAAYCSTNHLKSITFTPPADPANNDLSQLNVNGAVSLTIEGVSYTSGPVTLSKVQ